MRTPYVFVAALAAVLLAQPALAQVGKGLSGPHYQVNFIGVPKGKKVDMTNSDRRTVFVPLNTSGQVDGRVKIAFLGGDSFGVLDGNATDQDGATIQVPYAYDGSACYDVYAAALGKPGGSAHIEAEILLDDTALLSLDQVEFTAVRSKGRPVRQDISDIFRVSGCVDVNASGVCDAGDEFFSNEWLFNIDEVLSYWWNWTNDGLKLLQVRFYDCSGTAAKTMSASSATASQSDWGAVKQLYR